MHLTMIKLVKITNLFCFNSNIVNDLSGIVFSVHIQFKNKIYFGGKSY